MLIYAGKNRARLTTKNSVKHLDCAHQENLTNQQTPLERFLSKTEGQIINKKQDIIERLQNRENEILKSDPRDGNICRNCHLRLGHSARTCHFGPCTSVFKCGEEKYHSGENNNYSNITYMSVHRDGAALRALSSHRMWPGLDSSPVPYKG